MVTYNDAAYARSCGRTGHHYKDGLAFKFEDDAYETVLRSIEWTPSRTCLLYTSDDMTVDEILSLMTEEEAAELVVTTGVNKGWTMAQVSEQRPSSLKYYAYLCEDCGNIMKAAAMLLMGGSQQLKAS